MNIKISVGLFKMQITGPISRNANCIETEIGTEISFPQNPKWFWFRWPPGNTRWETHLVGWYPHSLVRKGWNFGQFWWMLPVDWFSSAGWWVSDILLLLLPYCRLGGPQWFVSAATVGWSGCQWSFGIQACKTDRSRKRQS